MGNNCDSYYTDAGLETNVMAAQTDTGLDSNEQQKDKKGGKQKKKHRKKKEEIDVDKGETITGIEVKEEDVALPDASPNTQEIVQSIQETDEGVKEAESSMEKGENEDKEETIEIHHGAGEGKIEEQPGEKEPSENSHDRYVGSILDDIPDEISGEVDGGVRASPDIAGEPQEEQTQSFVAPYVAPPAEAHSSANFGAMQIEAKPKEADSTEMTDTAFWSWYCICFMEIIFILATLAQMFVFMYNRDGLDAMQESSCTELPLIMLIAISLFIIKFMALMFHTSGCASSSLCNRGLLYFCLIVWLGFASAGIYEFFQLDSQCETSLEDEGSKLFWFSVRTWSYGAIGMAGWFLCLLPLICCFPFCAPIKASLPL